MGSEECPSRIDIDICSAQSTLLSADRRHSVGCAFPRKATTIRIAPYFEYSCLRKIDETASLLVNELGAAFACRGVCDRTLNSPSAGRHRSDVVCNAGCIKGYRPCSNALGLFPECLRSRLDWHSLLGPKIPHTAAPVDELPQSQSPPDGILSQLRSQDSRQGQDAAPTATR